jgi:hypothetical protein
MNGEARRAFSILTAAAAALVVIAVLHILDHMRQGADLGFLAALAGPFQLASALGILLLAALRSRWAPPWAALFGFFGPVGLIASHLLPHWWNAISYSEVRRGEVESEKDLLGHAPGLPSVAQAQLEGGTQAGRRNLTLDGTGTPCPRFAQ